MEEPFLQELPAMQRLVSELIIPALRKFWLSVPMAREELIDNVKSMYGLYGMNKPAPRDGQ